MSPFILEIVRIMTLYNHVVQHVIITFGTNMTQKHQNNSEFVRFSLTNV